MIACQAEVVGELAALEGGVEDSTDSTTRGDTDTSSSALARLHRQRSMRESIRKLVSSVVGGAHSHSIDGAHRAVTVNGQFVVPMVYTHAGYKNVDDNLVGGSSTYDLAVQGAGRIGSGGGITLQPATSSAAAAAYTHAGYKNVDDSLVGESSTDDFAVHAAGHGAGGGGITLGPATSSAASAASNFDSMSNLPPALPADVSLKQSNLAGERTARDHAYVNQSAV